MKKIANIFLFLCCFLALNSYAEKEKISIVGDYWCPYNCIPNTDRPGFLVELIQKSLGLYDIEVSYQMVPWSLALNLMDSGDASAIIGVSSTEGRALIATKMPLEYSQNIAYTRSGVTWVYDGINSLEGRKVGIIMDYVLDDVINNFIGMNYAQNPGSFSVQQGETAVIDAIAKLVSGEIDVYIEDQRVVEDYVAQNSLSSYIRDAGKVSARKLPIYIAFAKNQPKAEEYLKKFEQGLISLRATKEIEALKKKYNIKSYE